MSKSLFVFFTFFLTSCSYYLSQSSKDISYMFDGEVKLESKLEEVSPERNTDNGLLVDLIIRNKTYKFLLDTGASVSVLNDLSFKEENVNNSHEKVKIHDAVGTEMSLDLFYIDFKISENQFHNFAFTKIDLSKMLKNSCVRLDGILGANVLKKLNWKYSRTENKLFFSKNAFDYDGFNNPNKVQWFGSVPMIEMKINDYKFLGLIDTGHFGTIMIPNSVYIKNFGFGTHYNLIKGVGNPTFTVNGNQKMTLKKANISNLALENNDFSKYEVVLADVQPNIGNKIILENGFVFNFLKDEIAFGIEKEGSKYAILSKIKICRSEKDRSKLELCFFWKEEINKKLKLGDQVIQIDSINTVNIDDNQYCSLMSYISKNTSSKKIIFKRGNKTIEYISN